ncbi:MAG: tetraacyldisaccharide 4'-kinase [Planctomycetes bacterium]|nr:tetraacyldisaccharide 4'-kinase [Planctomycetota bacterium]
MPISAEGWYRLIRGERRGPLAAAARFGLRLASGPYGLGVWWRNRGFDRGRRPVFRAAVPVVSVGNLTLGGTGKTPCVEWVARYFRARDVRVTILSRGYGSEAGRNDEAMVLEENLPDVPHLQDPDRAAAAERAVEELESELLVLDDGFQHRRLHRDLDVVLIDAMCPPACDHLFPRGTLREPVSGLGRAGAIVLTRCDQVPPPEVEAVRAWLADRWPQTPIATTEHRPLALVGIDDASEPVEALAGAAVGGFCGIGNPAGFRHTLEGLGATVADFRAFPDHHAYTRADVESLTRWAESLPKGAVLATTQKDWVKLRVGDLAGRKLRAVRIGLHFRDGEGAFAAALERVRPS